MLCVHFPAHILQFVKRVCTYFTSGQRSPKLKELQIQAEVKEPLEVLRYVESRWESLLHCIERILKLWEYLEKSDS